MTTVKLSVAASDEIRVQITGGSSSGLSAQKLVSEKDGDTTKYWSFPWILEISSYLYESTELRTAYPALIDNLGFVLYSTRDLPSRLSVVIALKQVLVAWTVACSKDRDCLAPLPLKITQDPDITKLLKKYADLKKKYQATLGN